MSGQNYNGRQPNNTAYIKNFVYGTPSSLWKTMTYQTASGTYESVITPSSPQFPNLYIPGDLFVDGSIVNPSDINLKKNITPITIDTTDKIMNLKPTSFTFKNDSSSHIHYGFIAQELENEYPELIQSKPDSKYSKLKAVNYLEIIPLLVNKIQIMQQEIDMLKSKLENG
jgi:hypothetical protein